MESRLVATTNSCVPSRERASRRPLTLYRMTLSGSATSNRTAAGIGIGFTRVANQTALPPPARASTVVSARSALVRVGIRCAAAPCAEIVRVAYPVTAPGSTSAAANSLAFAQRSAGSLASAFSTAPSTFGGIVLRVSVSACGSALNTFATIACTVAPVKGGSPVSISYATAPSA